MQLKLFKYYLRFYNTTTSAWNYFYVDSNGVVQSTATKTELPQAPKGWDGQTLVWERGFEWYGVFTNYSNPLQFVNDGAKILKDRYYSQGIEAECQLLIEKHTNEVSTWGYQEYYKGDIDFSRFKDMKDFVEVSIMESGFLAKLKANEQTMREIPVEANPNVIWVNMDGIELDCKSAFVGITQPDNTQSLQLTSLISVPYLSWFINYGYNNGDIYPRGTNDNYGAYSQFYTTSWTGALTLAMQNQYFISNESATNTYDISLSGTFEIQAYNGSTTNITYCRVRALHFTKGNATLIANSTLGDGNNIGPLTSGTDNIALSGTFTLGPNEAIILAFYYSGASATVDPVDARVLAIDLEASWLNKVEQAYIPALPAINVAQAICEGIDQNVSTYSRPAIDYPAYLLTCGDALRNLPGSVLKTNFADYFSAINCMFNAAFYFDKANNEAQFLYKYFVFDPAVAPIDLGDVNNFEVSPLTQEMFSLLKIGYKPYSYDDYNGKDEFNTEYQFKSPLNRVTTERNLVSPYRADMYGIELIRANLTDKQQADKDSDNDVFWLHIDDSAPAGTIPAGLPGAGQDYYNLYRDNTLTVTGVLSPSTAFNIDFSPKRRMYSWGYWIRSVMYPNLSPDLVYQSTMQSQANNVSFETDDGVTIITEKVNEPISGLPGTSYTLESPNRNQIFYPLIFTVETKIPSNIMDLMTNPHGEFQFTYKGNTYYGWLLQVSDEPSFTPKQTYKLIASTSNNLTDLINGL